MRIVIDLQGVQTESRFRGIGRYTMSFAQAVVRNRGTHEIFLALNGLFPDSIETIRSAFFGLLPPENIRVWYAPGPLSQVHAGNAQRHTVAELVREAFLASLRPDLIHISSLFEGFADDAVTSIGRFDPSTPVSVALYDLIPLLNADHYLTHNPPYERYYRSKVQYIKRPTNLLLAISEFARREGLEHLGLPESQLVNVSTAIGTDFTQLDIGAQAARQIRSKYGITRHFVLYTGGDDERKNLPRLIQAYAALPPTLRHSHQLLFAGKMGENNLANFQHLARSVGLRNDELLFTGYVSDAELVQLYNLCALYVFPSWHEGFGLPALQAMACGAPVIGANASSLPEVIGCDEALFNPLDVASISAKMERALSDTAFRQRLREHGLQQAKHFSWDQTAQRAIAAWEAWHDKQQVACYASPTTIKPRLAFVSPLPPERTGIADYSAELLPALAQFYDIYVVVDQELTTDSWVTQSACIRDISWLQQHAQHMDYVLYQFGNSPFHKHMLPLLKDIPGTVVLHDFYMSGLAAWLENCAEISNAWIRALYQAHGYGAVQMRISDEEAAKLRYPANFEILQYAQGVIVHSKYSQKLANQWYADITASDWEVIPLLRQPPEVWHKMDCKKALGFSKDDFVLCSFGFLDETKLNRRLLSSWLASALAKDQRCHLIFVGENHGGQYGAHLLEAIQNSEAATRIHITGFASPELFRQYLGAADLAVQLRTQSRGETSAAVLDCMNHALPVIVNANGSIAELDANTVWMLPDEFDDADLINALETLWRSPTKRQALGEKARTAILERHDPARCAAMYAAAIARFHARAQTTTHALLQRLLDSGQLAAYSDVQLLELADAIAATLPLPRPAKNLLLDITATASNDLKTGIERVARAITLALIQSPPPGYRVEPVYLAKEGGVWQYRYARSYTLELLGCQNDILEDDDIVAPQAGDILLGLDLSGDTLVQAQQQGLHSTYRDRGVVVYFMVHDLLPVNQPDVFPPAADLGHATWLNAISSFDGAICVSKAVADDLSKWQQEKNPRDERQRPFVIHWSHHGADLANSAPSPGLPRSAQGILRQMTSRPTFLMVGTIEPRKSYAQAVAAFTQLWQAGVDVNLVIVGAEGWKDLPAEARRDIPKTVEQLRQHPESGKRLFWLAGISDEYLEKVYAASTCLIAASYGEGFGLPLIEAAQHQLPIIARDLPVFREVAGAHAYYFQAESAADLAQAVQRWLALYREGQHPQSTGMSWLTWRESAQNLWHQICGTS